MWYQTTVSFLNRRVELRPDTYNTIFNNNTISSPVTVRDVPTQNESKRCSCCFACKHVAGHQLQIFFVLCRSPESFQLHRDRRAEFHVHNLDGINWRSAPSFGFFDGSLQITVIYDVNPTSRYCSCDQVPNKCKCFLEGGAFCKGTFRTTDMKSTITTVGVLLCQMRSHLSQTVSPAPVS